MTTALRLHRRRHGAAGRPETGSAPPGGAVWRPVAIAAAALLLAQSNAPAGAAGAPPPGATACSGCHGPAAGPSVGPSITGRAASETSAIMDEFRSGARAGTVMPRIAKGFTAEETRAIAEWWATPTAGAKP